MEKNKEDTVHIDLSSAEDQKRLFNWLLSALAYGDKEESEKLHDEIMDRVIGERASVAISALFSVLIVLYGEVEFSPTIEDIH